MHSSFHRGRAAACAGVVAAITTYGLAWPASAAPPSLVGELTDIRHLSPAAAGLEDADRVAWSADLGRVVVAGGDGSSAVAVDLAEDDGDPVPAPPDAVVAEPESAPVTARNAEDGLTYAPDAEQGLLVGADDSGAPVSAYSAGDVDLAGVRSMTFAPSTDPTDDPAAQHLFLLSDAGGGETVVTEAALTPAAVRATATRSARLVATIDTTTWSPTSPDPAGIAYDAERDRLLVTDSEVNETPHWAGVNYWETTRAGEVQATGLGGVRGGEVGGPWFNSADFSCRNQTVEVCVEPTGIDIDSRTGNIFVSNDDSDEVVEIARGRDGRFGTRDDVRVSRVYLAGAINADGEGVAVDTKRGVLLILAGTEAEVYRVAPGPDGSFGGTDNVVTSFDVGRHGAIDPEGITYDPIRDRVAVVEHTTERIYEMNPVDGTLLDVVDVNVESTINMAGLTIAPRSDGSDERAYYIADRGIDNDQPPNADPNENDGKIYEVTADLGPLEGEAVTPRQETLTGPVDRLGGLNRVETAIKASQTAWTAPDGAFPANAVVLARQDDYADAMVGGPLAAAVGGPLLLTDSDELSSATLTEMRRILERADIVYLLGGTGAISGDVARQVNQEFSIARIEGGDRLGHDRYGTAVRVAEVLEGFTGGAPASVALASGLNYPDGLAAGAAAGAFGQPVLLTKGDQGVPAATQNYRRSAERVAVGGPAAATGDYAVELDGDDRYDTARLVAEHYFGDADPADAPWLVGVATGMDWPDALTGGAFMATYRGPLLLTKPDGLPEHTTAAITALEAGARDVTHGAVFGGTGVVSDGVRDALRAEIAD